MALTDAELTHTFEMDAVEKFLCSPSTETNDERKDDVIELLSLFKYQVIHERDRNNKGDQLYIVRERFCSDPKAPHPDLAKCLYSKTMP